MYPDSEAGARVRRALHFDRPLQRLDKALADRKTETCARRQHVRPAALGESVEQHVPCRAIEPVTCIFHGDRQDLGILIMVGRYCNRSSVGELDGIAYQIDQNLDETVCMGFQEEDGWLWPYRIIYDLLPGWEAIRTPGRLATFATLGLALLAAAGAEALLRGLARRMGELRAEEGARPLRIATGAVASTVRAES